MLCPLALENAIQYRAYLGFLHTIIRKFLKELISLNFSRNDDFWCIVQIDDS